MSLNYILGAGAAGLALWKLLKGENLSMLGQIQPYIDPGPITLTPTPGTLDQALFEYQAAIAELLRAQSVYGEYTGYSFRDRENQRLLEEAWANAQRALDNLNGLPGADRLNFRPQLPPRPDGTEGGLRRFETEAARQQANSTPETNPEALLAEENAIRQPVASVDPTFRFGRPSPAPSAGAEQAILLIETGSPGTPGVTPPYPLPVEALPPVPSVDPVSRLFPRPARPVEQERPSVATFDPIRNIFPGPSDPVQYSFPPSVPTGDGTLGPIPGQPLEVVSPHMPLTPPRAPVATPGTPRQTETGLLVTQPPPPVLPPSVPPPLPPTPTPGSRRPVEVISPSRPLLPPGRPPVATPGTLPTDVTQMDDLIYPEPETPPVREGTRECPPGTTRDPYSQECLQDVATPGGGMSVWDIINLGPSGANAPPPEAVSPVAFDMAGRRRMQTGPVNLKRAMSGFRGGRSIFG